MDSAQNVVGGIALRRSKPVYIYEDLRDENGTMVARKMRIRIPKGGKK